MRRPTALLAILSLVLGSSACSDDRAEQVGKQVAAQLKTDPAVASVGYGYEPPSAIDAPYQPPYLAFFVHLVPGRQDVADVKPLIRSAAETVWQTPVKLNSLVIDFFPAPASSAPADQSPARLFHVAIPMGAAAAPRQASDAEQDPGLRDFAQALQQELQAKYGPRKS